MLRVFAKLETDEKAAVFCGFGESHMVMCLLKKKFGGDWVPVQDVHRGIECIKFNDGQVYKGFSPDIEKYCSNVIEI